MKPTRTAKQWQRAIVVFIGVAVILTGCTTAARVPAAVVQPNPIPALSYYYIWYDTGSWDRAKVDYPTLGRYSSDDVAVMRQHIQWAKAAGITGFIVSWKSTDPLNRRLEKLIKVADAENFKLEIIYQGLDFDRKPLPVDRIAADLDYFIEHYASDKAFYLFDKPVVIWSGIWEFSPEDVARVTEGRRDRLFILASEKNVDGYRRVAHAVDGDAYYWSSVNPDTFKGYAEKLTEMGQAVHANGGLWIAPAAAGFDARLVGGTTVVDRKDGETLRQEMDVAVRSAPDAIGLISWNEFSENSHIEPSASNGTRYLNVLAGLRLGVTAQVADFDSSEPGNTRNNFDGGRIVALGLIVALVLTGAILLARRKPV